MVGEQLHRDVRDHRLQHADFGDVDRLGTVGVGLVDRREPDHRRAAGFDFLGVVERVVWVRRVREEGDDGGVRGNERERAVLELARREPLGVVVGDLLELEGALQRYGMVQLPADEEEGLPVGVFLGSSADLGLVVENRLYRAGECLDRIEEVGRVAG